MEELKRSPTPLAAKRGPTSKGREGRGGEERGVGRGREGKGGRGRGEGRKRVGEEGERGRRGEGEGWKGGEEEGGELGRDPQEKFDKSSTDNIANVYSTPGPKTGFFNRGAGNFGPKSEVRRSESGRRVLWKGAASPSPPSLAPAPGAKQFSRVLSVQSGLSMQFSVVYFSLFHSSNFCQGKNYDKFKQLISLKFTVHSQL